MQLELCMKKMWRLSGFDIPKDEEDSCCNHAGKGALARLGSLVGAGGTARDEHKEHKEVCLPSKNKADNIRIKDKYIRLFYVCYSYIIGLYLLGGNSHPIVLML